MKRLFTCVLVSMMALVAMAGSDLHIMKGDAKFFKTASGTAVVKFDFEGATYDAKMPLSEKWDVERVARIAKSGFSETFNDKSKKVKIVADDAAANYVINYKVTKMDQYFKVMGFIPGFATKNWGTITITDAASGEVLLQVDVVECDGGANPSPDETISDSFEDAAKQLAKFK